MSHNIVSEIATHVSGARNDNGGSVRNDTQDIKS